MQYPVLRVFSYLPNPRVWKSLIAARLRGVDVEVIGDKPGELSGWLWDFNARPLAAHELTADSPHAQGKARFCWNVAQDQQISAGTSVWYGACGV